MPVAHACNPSYSGGRDQEDRSSKPANSSWEPILKKPYHKKIGLVGWLSSSPSPAKTNKQTNKQLWAAICHLPYSPSEKSTECKGNIMR
jgi:hypothetical protein